MAGAEKELLTVALAGNPNVGKSTLFNRLTGLKQHTGNWPGKTVELIQGTAKWKGKRLCLTDLPGTYSLRGESEDEVVAAQYITGGQADCIVAVCDGSCLERSLIFVLELLRIADRVVVCVNLMDEAERKGITVDGEALSKALNVPVVLTSAGSGQGIDRLMETVLQTAAAPKRLIMPPGDNSVEQARMLAARCSTRPEAGKLRLRQQVDRLLVSRRFGVPLLVCVLLFIVWLTVWGANGISNVLEHIFDLAYGRLWQWMAGSPGWLRGLLVEGMFATAGRVLCVMLPPMAIFFPLFTFLEDVGYLPRMAFLLDPAMARCGGCGRQALTLCMGLGCNAVGVMGCRILSSPKQRLAAMLTNAFVPCNGRFPSLILLGTLLFPEAGAALTVAACVALGTVGAMAVSGLLHKTVLRSEGSVFVMEMPPFRRPRLGQILLRSLIDRTLHISARAVTVAAPAGALLYLLTHTGGMDVLCRVLSPLGNLMGMDGRILAAFLFCLPANELLLPVLLMLLGGGSLQAAAGMGTQLLSSVIAPKTAVCMMLFTLFHWPCATTLMTFYRETRSVKKTAAAFLLPTAVGGICCVIANLLL